MSSDGDGEGTAFLAHAAFDAVAGVVLQFFVTCRQIVRDFAGKLGLGQQLVHLGDVDAFRTGGTMLAVGAATLSRARAGLCRGGVQHRIVVLLFVGGFQIVQVVVELVGVAGTAETYGHTGLRQGVGHALVAGEGHFQR